MSRQLGSVKQEVLSIRPKGPTRPLSNREGDRVLRASVPRSADYREVFQDAQEEAAPSLPCAHETRRRRSSQGRHKGRESVRLHPRGTQVDLGRSCFSPSLPRQHVPTQRRDLCLKLMSAYPVSRDTSDCTADESGFGIIPRDPEELLVDGERGGGLLFQRILA